MENKIMDITSKERLLLKQIRKRTPMYVGEYSLNKLGDFFEGYREALFNLIKEVPPLQCCKGISGGGDLLVSVGV